MVIMQDALPGLKRFLKPVGLNERLSGLVIRCVAAFVMHLGRMAAVRADGGSAHRRRRPSRRQRRSAPAPGARRDARPAPRPQRADAAAVTITRPGWRDYAGPVANRSNDGGCDREWLPLKHVDPAHGWLRLPRGTGREMASYRRQASGRGRIASVHQDKDSWGTMLRSCDGYRVG